MCFLPFSLLFIQSVSLWILIFHIQISNFLVDILTLHGKKFLKINKFINKTFVITIFPHDINVLIDTHVYGIRFTVDICVFVYLMFQSVDFLYIFTNFLFASDNSVCIFFIFVSISLTLFVLLVFSTLRLFLF